MPFRTIFLTLACVAGLVAGPEDPARQTTRGTVGPVAFQTFAAGTYFYLGARATRTELPALTPALVKRLSAIQRAAGLQAWGPLLMIQRGAGDDPAKPFDLEVGSLVPAGTLPFGEAKVRLLAAFPCATTVASGDFSGEVAKAAFLALFKAAGKQGRTPTGESRELVLFWEGEGSANNLLQVQIGLQ